MPSRPAEVNARLDSLRRLFFWILPPLFCLLLYWPGLKTWFFGDDFVWLGLLNGVDSWNGLWYALFQPTIHGTFRPLSERGVFLLFRWLFGFDALPFHVCIFVTQFANLALVSAVMLRLTGSRTASFLAPVLWGANANLATVMSWASSYMQVLCGSCLLLAFWLLLRYIDTGDRRYYWAQWAVFLLGFGVMETNLVYPALASVYALFQARRYLPRILPMFAVSGAYAVAHLMMAPKAAIGAYAMHFDVSIARTVWTYWQLALNPHNAGIFSGLPESVLNTLMGLLTGSLLAFVVYRLSRRDWLPVVFLSWFLILLAPVAPLRDHISDYYLTLPVLGLAMLAAYAVGCAWRVGLPARGVAAVLVLAYLFVTVAVARGAARWNLDRSREVREIVLGVAAAHELHPGKTILLTGVDNLHFGFAIFDRPFEALRIPGVYLAPGSETAIEQPVGTESISNYVLSPAVVKRELKRGRIEVYQAGGPRLKNITETYEESAGDLLDAAPRRVDAGDAATESLFGPEWYRREGTFRWMPKSATVSISGPRSPSEKLYLEGSCSALELKGGPLHLSVAAEERLLGRAELTNCDHPFRLDFPFPSELQGKNNLQLKLEVDRTLTVAGDDRKLGLMFGRFEVK